MDAFGNRLENFDVQRGSTAVVSIVLVIFVTGDALCPFGSRDLSGGRLGYPRNDLMDVERKDGRVGVDGVGVQDFWEFHRFEHGFG